MYSSEVFRELPTRIQSQAIRKFRGKKITGSLLLNDGAVIVLLPMILSVIYTHQMFSSAPKLNTDCHNIVGCVWRSDIIGS